MLRIIQSCFRRGSSSRQDLILPGLEVEASIKDASTPLSCKRIPQLGLVR